MCVVDAEFVCKKSTACSDGYDDVTVIKMTSMTREKVTIRTVARCINQLSRAMIRRENLLAALDRLIAVFVVFPLTILHWRGSWELQDIYIAPSDAETSCWISLGIGANVGLVAALVQPYAAERLSLLVDQPAASSPVLSTTVPAESPATAARPWHRFLCLVVSRLHVYIHGWALMCYWRGLWCLLDLYLTTNWINSTVVYVICQLVLVASKSVRTAAGLPLTLQTDSATDLLQPDSVFGTPYSNIVGYVLDQLFTQHIVVFSTICVWRGIWNVLDASVFPYRHFLSDVSSLAVGLTLVAAAFAVERPMSAISAALGTCPIGRLVFEDLLFVGLVWVNLFLWRGASNLCTYFILPPRKVGGGKVGAWATHLIGTVGLMSMNAFSNVGMNGIEKDGSLLERGEGIYRIRYLADLVDGRQDARDETNKKYADPSQVPCTESDSLIGIRSPTKPNTGGQSQSGSLHERSDERWKTRQPDRRRLRTSDSSSVGDENENSIYIESSDDELNRSSSAEYSPINGEAAVVKTTIAATSDSVIR